MIRLKLPSTVHDSLTCTLEGLDVSAVDGTQLFMWPSRTSPAPAASTESPLLRVEVDCGPLDAHLVEDGAVSSLMLPWCSLLPVRVGASRSVRVEVDATQLRGYEIVQLGTWVVSNGVAVDEAVECPACSTCPPDQVCRCTLCMNPAVCLCLLHVDAIHAGTWCHPVWLKSELCTSLTTRISAVPPIKAMVARCWDLAVRCVGDRLVPPPTPSSSLVVVSDLRLATSLLAVSCDGVVCGNGVVITSSRRVMVGCESGVVSVLSARLLATAASGSWFVAALSKSGSLPSLMATLWRVQQQHQMRQGTQQHTVRSRMVSMLRSDSERRTRLVETAVAAFSSPSQGATLAEWRGWMDAQVAILLARCPMLNTPFACGEMERCGDDSLVQWMTSVGDAFTNSVRRCTLWGSESSAPLPPPPPQSPLQSAGWEAWRRLAVEVGFSAASSRAFATATATMAGKRSPPPQVPHVFVDVVRSGDEFALTTSLAPFPPVDSWCVPNRETRLLILSVVYTTKTDDDADDDATDDGGASGSLQLAVSAFEIPAQHGLQWRVPTPKEAPWLVTIPVPRRDRSFSTAAVRGCVGVVSDPLGASPWCPVVEPAWLWMRPHMSAAAGGKVWVDDEQTDARAACQFLGAASHILSSSTCSSVVPGPLVAAIELKRAQLEASVGGAPDTQIVPPPMVQQLGLRSALRQRRRIMAASHGVDGVTVTYSSAQDVAPHVPEQRDSALESVLC